MTTAIKLVIGLKNPDQRYGQTRHNAGAWWLESLAEQHDIDLSLNTKLKSHLGKLALNDQSCLLALPTTYMNHSGEAAQLISHYYKIQPEQILIVHDELDFNPGTNRLKYGGGHGGHNGVRDVITHLNTDKFYRLRIGIGHPNHQKLVENYVLDKPSIDDYNTITNSFSELNTILPMLLKGDIADAMKTLHSEE